MNENTPGDLDGCDPINGLVIETDQSVGRSPTQKEAKQGREALTSSVLLQLPEGPHKATVALVALIVLGVEQDLLGIDEQARDTGDRDRENMKLDGFFFPHF